MSSITQGTVISGVRSEKYNGINCCAIIINARCDLAQGKTNKIYYLVAMSLEEWLFSSIGISTIYIGKINDLGKKIQQKKGIPEDAFNFMLFISFPSGRP